MEFLLIEVMSKVAEKKVKKAISKSMLLEKKLKKMYSNLRENDEFSKADVTTRILDKSDSNIRQNEQIKLDKKKQIAKLHQIISQSFPLLLNEECRAYLIDLRVEWLGNRPENWYTNLEVNTKTFIFIVDLYFGLLWSRIKRLNPMSRKPKF